MCTSDTAPCALHHTSCCKPSVRLCRQTGWKDESDQSQRRTRSHAVPRRPGVARAVALLPARCAGAVLFLPTRSSFLVARYSALSFGKWAVLVPSGRKRWIDRHTTSRSYPNAIFCRAKTAWLGHPYRTPVRALIRNLTQYELAQAVRRSQRVRSPRRIQGPIQATWPAMREPPGAQRRRRQPPRGDR